MDKNKQTNLNLEVTLTKNSDEKLYYMYLRTPYTTRTK